VLHAVPGGFDDGQGRVELVARQADVGVAPEALREDARFLDGGGSVEVVDDDEEADREPPGPALLRGVVLGLAATSTTPKIACQTDA